MVLRPVKSSPFIVTPFDAADMTLDVFPSHAIAIEVRPLNPTPYTLHPAYTLTSQPYTLHPTYTLQPRPDTLKSQP